ncbi:ankyrin repeat domain-containing protein 50-like [Dysidea avara]|uniref:ankyrin repeat domain-containing protein 50-like n=1 Tax=Dysidea avara TaxID=196820 RepID=UPI0033206562
MARSKDGWTCAMCACSSGHGQLAQMLFAAGCDVNALSQHDLSALHIVAWKGHVHVIEILIAEGSALDQKSKNGKTALDLARDEGHQECCVVLEAAMGMNTTDLSVRLKADEGQLKVVQEKLQFSQESFSELLKKEKKQWENEVVVMKKQHVKEINNLKEEITVLTDKLTSKMALVIPFPQVELSGPESPRPIRKHKKSSHHPRRRPTELPSTLTTHLMTPVDSHLNKSADNLAQWGSMDNVDSDDGAAAKMSTKLSITELVEESLRKPEGMASIRKELKEAN